VSATIIPVEPSQAEEKAGITRVKLIFDEPQLSITPGQAAVWYDGDVLLGGGIIERNQLPA
jgi:tRNA-specific 2-thiouridylase